MARCLKVAVLAPMRQVFDYLAPAGLNPDELIGCRVRVPFGKGSRLGVIVEVDEASLAAERIKNVTELIDKTPLLPGSLLALALWAADYYCHPPGEVLAAVFPLELRRGEAPRESLEDAWMATEAGREILSNGTRLGVRQAHVLGLAAGEALRASSLLALPFDARRVLRELTERQWLCAVRVPPVAITGTESLEAFLDLNDAQALACAAVLEAADRYRTYLLEGITGSGKTEVYLHLARAMQADGRQTLVLIPEIGLSEQLVRRFQRRFGSQVALLHSDLSDRERALVWERCRVGEVAILIGTRSALWTPLANLGLVIVDEEHDASFKQQEGFRYSARDIAVMRARQDGIPVVLGSATPSLESESNVRRGKYARLRLPERTAGAIPPVLRGLDVRSLPLTGGLSDALCKAMDEVLGQGQQVLLFLNRRGYAPLVMCHACGWIARCERCDARLVLHRESGRLSCHHCGAGRNLARQPVTCCPQPMPMTLGVGTEQVEEALRQRFPGRRILRIDRDSMRRKGQFEAACAAVLAGEVDILLGTQMLAKGHDFPEVTLVGIVDADSRLFATDFRAAERFAQLVIQVAGRAGRGSKPGLVLIQTHHPDHPVLRTVLESDYPDFVALGLAEREAAGLPPLTAMAVIRAEAGQQALPTEFLSGIRRATKSLVAAEVRIAGPVPATMERRAGKFRAVLMVSAERRGALADALLKILKAIEESPSRHRVRWHIDVDPEEAG